MTIPENIRDNVSAIASYVSKTYGLPTDGIIEMKNNRSDLFQFYITYKNDSITDVSIEQYNGDEGSYARLSKMQELVDDKRKTFGTTTDCSREEDPRFPGDIKTCEHTWMRFHKGDYVNFMTGMCLLIRHCGETHRGRLLDKVKKSLNEVEKYSRMATDLKT